MKFLKWCLDHLRIVVAVILFPIVLIVSGVLVLKSYNDYKAYEKQYEKDVLEVRAATPLPNSVFVDDEFVSFDEDGIVSESKSSFSNNVTFYADAPVVTKGTGGYDAVEGALWGFDKNGGSFSIAITMNETNYLDIVFSLRSSAHDKGGNLVSTENLFENVAVTINAAELVTDPVTLEAEEGHADWHQVVFEDMALSKGNNVITFTSVGSSANGAKIMPDFQKVTFLSNAEIDIGEVNGTATPA